MKRTNLLIFVALVSLFLCPITDAAEILDDWTPYIDGGNVTFTPNGTSIDMTAEGSAGEAWAKWEKSFNNAIPSKFIFILLMTPQKLYLNSYHLKIHL